MRRLLLLLIAASAVSAGVVRFKTDDGIEIVADYTAGAKDAPTVICLPMFRNVRKSYAPLATVLAAAGINVLAVDLRGHGDSAPHLRPKVVGRDAVLFNAMHKDVAAAIDFLEKEKGCDRTSIGIVGASVGCSVAVDCAVRYRRDVRAVVLLTPGANYLGVPTLEHLKQWPGTRVWSVCSDEERRTSKPVHDVLRGFNGTRIEVHHEPGTHGTRIFGKVKDSPVLIADFLVKALAPAVDLRAPAYKTGDPALRKPGFFRQVLGPRRGGHTMLVWAVGDELHVAPMVKKGFEGTVVVRVGDETHEIPLSPDRKQPRAGEWTWAEKTFPRFTKSFPLTVEYRPAKGDPVRLPAGRRHFHVTLEAR